VNNRIRQFDEVQEVRDGSRDLVPLRGTREQDSSITEPGDHSGAELVRLIESGDAPLDQELS
jgi:hypothetical protein